jgi:hypothetical protein
MYSTWTFQATFDWCPLDPLGAWFLQGPGEASSHESSKAIRFTSNFYGFTKMGFVKWDLYSHPIFMVDSPLVKFYIQFLYIFMGFQPYQPSTLFFCGLWFMMVYDIAFLVWKIRSCKGTKPRSWVKGPPSPFLRVRMDPKFCTRSVAVRKSLHIWTVELAYIWYFLSMSHHIHNYKW